MIKLIVTSLLSNRDIDLVKYASWNLIKAKDSRFSRKTFFFFTDDNAIIRSWYVHVARHGKSDRKKRANANDG